MNNHLLGIPASVILVIRPGGIGLTLGYLTVLALAVTVALSIGDAIFTPWVDKDHPGQSAFVFGVILGSSFRIGLGIWYYAALWIACRHKFPPAEAPRPEFPRVKSPPVPEWLKVRRFPNAM